MVRQSGPFRPISIRDSLTLLEPWTFVSFSAIRILGGFLILIYLYKIARVALNCCCAQPRDTKSTKSGRQKPRRGGIGHSIPTQIQFGTIGGGARHWNQPDHNITGFLKNQGDLLPRLTVVDARSEWELGEDDIMLQRTVNINRNPQRGLPSRRGASFVEQMVGAAAP